jgi:hypothetical protein
MVPLGRPELRSAKSSKWLSHLSTPVWPNEHVNFPCVEGEVHGTENCPDLVTVVYLHSRMPDVNQLRTRPYCYSPLQSAERTRAYTCYGIYCVRI